MPPLGAHMSIAGGFFKAAEAASALGMDTVQIFTHSPSQWVVKPVAAPRSKVPARTAWRAEPLREEDTSRFIESCARHALRFPLSHSSYLINLATPDPELWQKSVVAFVAELERATQLGIAHVVLHPGSHTSAPVEEGIANVVRALDEIHRQTDPAGARCLLETTAGQGSCLGWRFEQLSAILAGVADPERLGVCFDTCHVFAAGYPLTPAAAYRATMGEFDRLIGLDRIRAFHLNDSKKELGSRVDRHEHIGEGKLGLEPFRQLLRDRRFRDVPMYLETPKGRRDGEELDAINLRTLRACAK